MRVGGIGRSLQACPTLQVRSSSRGEGRSIRSPSLLKRDGSVDLRFLCLPIFDEGFRSVLVELNLDKIEMWLALSDSSHGTADHKLSEILPALTKKQEVADKILQRLDMVNILASIISRSTEKIQQEIATDLGYGSAEPPRAGVKRSSADAPIAAPAPKALGAKPAGLGPVEEVTSLQSVELSERRKWGARLSAISTKAGAAAGINDQSRCTGLMPEEAARLKTMSFEAGGSRTIRKTFVTGRSLTSGQLLMDFVFIPQRSWRLCVTACT